MIDFIFELIGVIFIAYLIGSIPTGYIAVKLFKNVDIRTIGSGSTGATNVKRVMGTKWFFIVMLLDALKGFLPVFLSVKYLNFNGIVPVLTALGVLIGHSKSIFLGFTGGKSVATGVGTILALSLPVGLVTAIIWSLITYFTKYVSVGSIIAVALVPTLMSIFSGNIYYVCFGAVCAAYVIIRHKDNIQRLLEGRESKVRE